MLIILLWQRKLRRILNPLNVKLACSQNYKVIKYFQQSLHQKVAERNIVIDSVLKTNRWTYRIKSKPTKVTNKSKLQALYHHQKHAAKIINFKEKLTSPKPLLEEINAMTVYEMNTFQTLCFMYLCKNGNTPSVFKHIYELKPINKYTTKSKNILFKPLCKKNFAKFKLSYRGPHLWNKFIAPNNDLLEAVTIHIFKIRFKKIIFASTNILEDF